MRRCATFQVKGKRKACDCGEAVEIVRFLSFHARRKAILQLEELVSKCCKECCAYKSYLRPRVSQGN